MNKYEEIIKTEKFKSTNRIWNEKHLNAISKVGPMMKIVRDCKSIAIFENEYFKKYHGLDRINEAARELKRACAAEGIELTDQEAIDYAYIRIVYQTWQGHKRELEVIDMFKTYSNLAVFQSTYEEDVKYAIDAKVYKDGHLLFGLQIKPMSYKNYYSQQHKINKEKNELFKKDFRREVIYIYI